MIATIEIKIEHKTEAELIDRLNIVFKGIYEGLEKLHLNEMNKLRVESGYAFPEKIEWEIIITGKK